MSLVDLPFCFGRASFATKAEAFRRLRRMRVARRGGHEPPRPFRCRECGKFHLRGTRR